MASKKELKHAQRKAVKLKTEYVGEVKLPVSFKERFKYLTDKPHKGLSVNEVVVSNLIRGLEVEKGYQEAETVLGDNSRLLNFEGQRLVFVADLVGFEEDVNQTIAKFLNLTLVGAEVEGVLTPIERSISNMVAEKYEVNFGTFDFGSTSGKILKGMTFLFSGKVQVVAGKPIIIDIKVLEFGLRLFNSDGSVDTLALITEEVDTYNYELLVVRQGDVIVNPYINVALQPFVQAYLESKDQKDLIAGADYIIRTYDLPYSGVGTAIGGIARIVEE
jgi:hypothetical protein